MSTIEPNDPLEPTPTPEQTPEQTYSEQIHSEQIHAEQAQAPEPSKRSAFNSEYAPLYAVAGLTDVLASTLKKTLAQTQERATQRAALLRGRDPALEGQAKLNAEELRKLIKGVPGQAKGLSEATRARMAELQRQLQMYRREAALAYAELAVRGKRAVDETMVTAKTLSGRAEAKVEDVREDLVGADDQSRPARPVGTPPVGTSPVDTPPSYVPGYQAPGDSPPVDTPSVETPHDYAAPSYTDPGDVTGTAPSYTEPVDREHTAPNYTDPVDPEHTPPIYTEPVDPDAGERREGS